VQVLRDNAANPFSATCYHRYFSARNFHTRYRIVSCTRL
jgi:hypothetical protein